MQKIPYQKLGSQSHLLSLCVGDRWLRYVHRVVQTLSVYFSCRYGSYEPCNCPENVHNLVSDLKCFGGVATELKGQLMLMLPCFSISLTIMFISRSSVSALSKLQTSTLDSNITTYFVLIFVLRCKRTSKPSETFW